MHTPRPLTLSSRTDNHFSFVVAAFDEDTGKVYALPYWEIPREYVPDTICTALACIAEEAGHANITYRVMEIGG